MSTEKIVNELKEMASQAAATSNVDPEQALKDFTESQNLDELKERFMKLDKVSRDMVGFVALLKLVINGREKLTDEQQVDILENGVMFYRGTVLLHIFEVVLPVLTNIAALMEGQKELTKAEQGIIKFAQDTANLAIQIDNDHEKDRKILFNLLEMLRPDDVKNDNNS
jgi:hypothetical protein